MKVKLGEVADQIRGVTYKSQDVEETLSNNSIPLLRANNISNNGIINYDDVIYIKKNKIDSVQLIKQNDILVCASSGSVHLVGKAAQIKEDKLLSFGAFCKVIRPKNIHAIYLGYFFQSPYYRKTISSLAQGANINNIRNDDIDNLMINIYDDVATQEIVSILDKVTSLISMRKEQLGKLDVLVKSKFIEMFGDPVLNPKGWEKKKLGEVCDVRDGTHDSPKFRFTGYPLITSKNIVNNQLVLDKVNYISQDDYDKINKRSKVDKGDILLPMIGTIGNPVIINIEPNFAIKNVALIKFNNPNITNTYIYNILTSNYIEYVKNILSRGGTQKFIALADIRKLMIPIPPLDLQNQFAEFVEQVEKNKEKIKSSLNQLETLYNALMQEYFG